MNPISLSPELAHEISALARRYLWWDAVDPRGHTLARMIAQIVQLGTYDDILPWRTSWSRTCSGTS